MSKLPEAVIGFLQRPVPIFVHLAAANKGETPFICRGYGFRFESERLWIYILKSQWLRLKDYQKNQGELSALLTSGVDNESYQFKGRFSDLCSLTKEDTHALAEQFRWVTQHAPNLAPIIHVSHQ